MATTHQQALRDLAYRHRLERAALAAFLKATRREKEAAKLRKQAERLRAKIATKPKAPPVEHRPLSALLKLSKARTVRKTLFRAALHARGLYPAAWARQQKDPGVGVETVRSWLRDPDKDGRPCPRFWADRIAEEFTDAHGRSLVPARNSSWPSGIRE